MGQDGARINGDLSWTLVPTSDLDHGPISEYTWIDSMTGIFNGFQYDGNVRTLLSYEETMRLGAEEYGDVLRALRAEGWPSEFTQTGGMNAAILVRLEGGRVLLITDADESLSWTRRDQIGWGVGLYVNDELEGGALTGDSCESKSIEGLFVLVRQVMRSSLTDPDR